MTWTTPPTVVTGQIYTAAMFNTYTRDNSIHLRALLPDPSVIDRPLVSDGTTTASFRLLPDAGMLNQKTNIVPPVFITFAAVGSGYSGFFNVNNAPGVADGPIGGGNDYYCIQVRYPNSSIDYRLQLAWSITDTTLSCYQRLIIGGAPTAWIKTWSANNDGSGSTMDADLLDGRNSGNASNNIPISNDVMNASLNAQYLQGFQPGNIGGNVLAINNSVLNTGLNAQFLQGYQPVDIMPNEARIYFQTVAQLTAAGVHWTRDTASNGRMVLTADEAGAIPFIPDNNYGSGWTPVTGLGTSVGGVPASGGPFLTLLQGTVSSGLIPMQSHTHPAPSVSITGQGAFWTPPVRAYVLARRI